MSQKQLILEYLLSGKSITPLEALDLFKCFRLGARIWDLKKDGHDIKSEMVFDERSGKHYEKYWLATAGQSPDGIDVPPEPEIKIENLQPELLQNLEQLQIQFEF